MVTYLHTTPSYYHIHVCNLIFSCTLIDSYIQIHGLYTIVAFTIHDILRKPDILNYPIFMGYDIQSTPELASRFGITNCISKVCRYVHWIDVQGSRDDVIPIPEYHWSETSLNTSGDIIHNWQQQIVNAKRLDKYTQLRVIVETIASRFLRPPG